MADDPTAALAGILERNEHLRSRYGYVGGLLALTGAKDDVPHLVAAVEAVLKLADEIDNGGRTRSPVARASARILRERVRAALAGTGKEGSEDG